MPNRIRRAHTKSRFGCQQCKKRRIKCDFKHPSCGTCVKKGETCSFLQTAPPKHLKITFAGPCSSSPDTPSASSIEDRCSADSEHCTVTVPLRHDTSSPDERDSLPLHARLQDPRKFSQGASPFSLQNVLSHYTRTTSLTIENGGRETAVWQLGIPQIAAGYNFLTHCVLSVTSLHIAYLSGPEEQPKQFNHWNAIAASQMNQALAGYRHAIEKVTRKNVAAVFASSALTAVYFVRTSVLDFEDLEAAFPLSAAHTSEMAGKMISCIVRTMWGLRGPLEVLMKGWTWIADSSIQPVASRKGWPKDLWLQTDRQYGPHSQYLSQALDQLRETYALNSQLLQLGASKACHGTEVLLDRGALFSWVTRVPREYIQLVEAQDRDALVILAHFAVLLIRTNSVWWLEGLGTNFVRAVAVALGSASRKLIEWPAHHAAVSLS
ncbi:unnamed protein product [Alternaria burnsii]|nr:unnamed protein product [Alternaria burnsii]